MSQSWQKEVSHVSRAMLAHTRPFCTPLTREYQTKVELIGSGNYIDVPQGRLLLTCQHVSQFGNLDYRFNRSGNVYGYRGRWTAEKPNVDLSFAPVSDGAWEHSYHLAQAVPYARFDLKHAPSCQEELIFFRGYAGENSEYGFGIHQALATGYCSQEKIGSGTAEHFEIFWEPKNTQFSFEASQTAKEFMKFEDPRGFSGSLVWNTKYREAKNTGVPWHPSMAVVTGMAHRWDRARNTLMMYRVEHIRGWLEARLRGSPGRYMRIFYA